MSKLVVYALVFSICVWISCDAKDGQRKDGKIAPIFPSEEASKLFADFKSKYNKVYIDPAEEEYRSDIFKSNLEKYNDFNSKFNNDEESYFQGINAFSDLMEDEFNALSSGNKNYDAI